MSHYCVSRLTVTGPAAVVEGLDVVSLVPVAVGSEVGTYLSLPAAVPLPEWVPRDEAAFCHWAQQEWGCRDGPTVPAMVLARRPGRLAVEVTTRGGGIAPWARRLAARHGIAVEVLWNHESGAAGIVAIDAGGAARSVNVPADALAAHGWDDVPWVPEPAAGDVALADLLLGTDPTDAAAVVRGAATEDDVGQAAAVLTEMSAIAAAFAAVVVDALQRLDADFARRVEWLWVDRRQT